MVMEIKWRVPEDIKPCPFCGGELSMFTVNLATEPVEDTIDARCGKCGTKFWLRGNVAVTQGGYNLDTGMFEYDTIRGKSAIEKWNTRHYEDNARTENKI